MIIAFLAFVSTVMAIWALIPLAFKVGLLDQPNERKQHQGEVPLVGGIALIMGFSLACLWSDLNHYGYKGLFAGIMILGFVGLLDDFKELKPKIRLLAQIAVALLLIFKGDARLTSLGHLFSTQHTVLLQGTASTLFTVVCIVGLVNSINMIDGLDGLSGSLVWVSVFNLLLLSFIKGHPIDQPIMLALMGSLLGYLYFNFPHPYRPQRIFMGDVGSMFLGLILCWLSIRLTHEGVARPISMIWINALPLLDMAGVMLCRFLQGHKLFEADRNHIHHWFMAVGHSPQYTVTLLIACSWCLGAVGIFGEWKLIPEPFLFYGFLFLLFCYYWLIHHHSWLAKRHYRRQGTHK